MSDFLRYRSGEMTGSERNAFERMLQRDPFAAEAFEGLELISPAEAEEDLANLARWQPGRVRRLKRFYYPAAAAVVFLLGISSLLIFRNAPRREVQLADETMKKEAIADTLEQTSPIAGAETAKAYRTEDPASKRAGEVTKPSVSVPPGSATGDSAAAITGTSAVSDSTGKNLITDHVVAGQDKASKQPARVEVATLPARETLYEEALRARSVVSSLQGKVSGIVLSSEDNLPIPFANITIKGTTTGTLADSEGRFTLPLTADTPVTLTASFIGMETAEYIVRGDDTLRIMLKADNQALDEVIVVGYGSQMKRETDVFYKAPEPADGYRGFYSYLDNNMVWPAKVTDITRAVVIVDLPVSKYGVRGLPQIVRSPGADFSDEAIRVISRGPEWVPALKNNEAVDDTVRIRLVFRMKK